MGQPQMPLDDARYHPDPGEPVDRWFQAANASNARTTVHIVENVVREPPTVVIDPFAGGGSTASAARILRLPFYGIETDPVLACVSLAKAEGHTRHADLLAAFSGVHDPEGLAPALAEIRARCAPWDVPVVSAMAILAGLRAARNDRLTPGELGGDLTIHEVATPAGRIVRGDAGDGAAWKVLGIPPVGAVMYTSPPFDRTSPVLDAPEYLTAEAREVLGAGCVDTLGETVPKFDGYTNTTVGMLHWAAEHLHRATLVIEHEPDDDGVDSTTAVVERVRAELSDVVHNPRIVRCGEFSRRGMLSLMIFDFR